VLGQDYHCIQGERMALPFTSEGFPQTLHIPRQGQQGLTSLRHQSEEITPAIGYVATIAHGLPLVCLGLLGTLSLCPTYRYRFCCWARAGSYLDTWVGQSEVCLWSALGCWARFRFAQPTVTVSAVGHVPVRTLIRWLGKAKFAFGLPWAVGHAFALPNLPLPFLLLGTCRVRTLM